MVECNSAQRPMVAPLHLLLASRNLKRTAKSELTILNTKMITFDSIKVLAPFDSLFGMTPIFNYIFGASMLVCSQKT